MSDSMPRDSELEPTGDRSRRTFRWMPSPVLWHNVVRGDAPPPQALGGRNLYARKLREAGASDPPPDALERRNAQSELWRWQTPLAYLVIARRRGWLLTWHAPWCRGCDCPGAGWRFHTGPGYLSGFGFELSFPSSRQ